VALIEMNGQLGGTMTTGGVNAPAYFWSSQRQIIAGIGWELVTRSVELDGGTLPDFAHPSERRPSFHAPINQFLYPLLAEEECLKSGVHLHYHEIVSSAEREAGWWHVETVGNGLRRNIKARELIDCTGGADIVGMLGFERLREEVQQPGTLIFKLGGYNFEELDEVEIQSAYEAALADGRMRRGDFNHSNLPFIRFLYGGGRNVQHIFGADSSNSQTQTQANCAGRESLLRIIRFVKTLPGCEDVKLLHACTYTAARETYRIRGEEIITYDDYMSGRIFDDAVCYSLYFIDVHTHEGVSHEFLAPGLVPTVPLRALVPKGSEGLLVAGRSVSSDRLANSALRVQASCMAMGQAAGAAAALAARAGVLSRDVSLDDLRDLLREQGAIVPPD
jgi:hypothetical protein